MALLHNFQFDVANFIHFIHRWLVFNLKKTSEEKIFDGIIEVLSKNNDQYNTEHKEYSNVFVIKQDKRQSI